MYNDLMWWLVVTTPVVLWINFLIWKSENNAAGRNENPLVYGSRVPVPVISDRAEISRRKGSR
ncbi:MAG TPA: hypothetical protein VK448_10695 [Dissulfurispiraceae bacterium]|nr:hypothetical protein [Dissulfurispiraceae bacterium]